MPIDFSKKGINFLKFSMPTKASEYMISGTPVLLFCSNEVSLYQHAAKYKWAYCVKENNEQVLYDAIKFLLENENERKKISETAVRFAENHFDDIIVSSDFRESFSKLMQ
jgi:glycosyltransferase involved in cell wall biosynthesis